MATPEKRKSQRVALGAPEDADMYQVTQGINAYAVTKSDTTVFPEPCSLYVGGGGDVTVRMIGGTTVVYKAVPTGTFMPILVDQVLSTGTGATDILRLAAK